MLPPSTTSTARSSRAENNPENHRPVTSISRKERQIHSASSTKRNRTAKPALSNASSTENLTVDNSSIVSGEISPRGKKNKQA